MIGPGPDRDRVARRRGRQGRRGARQTRSTRSASRCPKPMPPLFPATMTEDVAPVDGADPQAGRHLAAAGRAELVGRQQLLRHDRAPDGAQPDQRRDLGPRSDSRSTTSSWARTAGCSPATRRNWRATPTSAPTSTPSATARWSPSLDGLPEQVPGKSPTGLPLDQYAGNHIVQDLGDGNYAFYAHLKTGSRQGEAGRPADHRAGASRALGNTGNTDAPHLHFHVMSTPDPLRSNGLAVRVQRRSGWIPGSPRPVASTGC